MNLTVYNLGQNNVRSLKEVKEMKTMSEEITYSQSVCVQGDKERQTNGERKAIWCKKR